MCLIHGIVLVPNLLPHSRVRLQICMAGAKRSLLNLILPHGVVVARGNVVRSLLNPQASGSNQSRWHRFLLGLWLDHVGEILTIEMEVAGAMDLDAMAATVAIVGLELLAFVAAIMQVVTQIKVITLVPEEAQIR